MKEDKLIILDWGGVIESHRDTEYSLNVAILSFIRRYHPGMSSKEILDKWNACLEDEQGRSIAIIGNLEEAKKWLVRIRDTFCIKEGIDELMIAYEEEFSKIDYYQDVVSLAHSLRGKCKIAILSNLSFFDKKRLDKQVSLNLFDYVFLSFELGHAKPNPEIYQIVEQRCGCRPARNLIPARERGWHTHQACGYQIEQIRDAISSFLQ